MTTNFPASKTQRAAFAARPFTTSSSLSSLLSTYPSSHLSSSLPSYSPQITVDFLAHPSRNEARIASLGTKCGRSLRKDQLLCAASASRATRIFARIASIFALAFALHACSFNEKFAPASLPYRVIATYPHSTEMFTEGLAIVDGEMYESGGRYGYSRVCRATSVRGDGRKCVELARQFFGEGLTVMGSRVLQLTWREGQGFIYDRSLAALGNFKYRGEGWGVTNDGKRLWVSDGTSELRVFDPASFKEVGTLIVRDTGHAVPFLNELEYARELIWANVWHSDGVAAIDPESGQVVAWLYLGDLRRQVELPRTRDEAENVLNGIAYDARTNHFFVTGKRWPVMFEIEVGEVARPHPAAAKH
jgi:glutaminyl-peptide cyclotransferase